MSVEEARLNPEQRALLLLWQRVNTSLIAFYKLLKRYHSAHNALAQPSSQWTSLGIHAKHVTRHTEASDATDDSFIKAIEHQLQADKYRLLFLDDEAYPEHLKQLFDPPPVLFYRGNLSRLNQTQIAIVGSRKPSSHAQKMTFDMAQYLAQMGYIICSGLAQGVDAQAHLGALSQPHSDQSGRTVGVMGTGIDVCYPKQHQVLFDRIVNEGGCIISELLPGTPPNKHTFPRRNRIVAGLSLGTIVTEAALKSGSLITARLAAEQGKQVFAIPSTIDNVNAQGCLHLIREGATLIYHPDHVLADLSTQVDPLLLSPAHAVPVDRLYTEDNAKKTAPLPQATNSIQAVNQQNTSPANAPTNIPEHLQTVWVHVDWEGQDLDALVNKTGLPTPALLSDLIELELMGAINQLGGRYLRA